MAPRPLDLERVHVVGDTLLIEASIAGQFATRAKARGSPALAADLLNLRMRLEGLAQLLENIVSGKPGRY